MASLVLRHHFRTDLEKKTDAHFFPFQLAIAARYTVLYFGTSAVKGAT